MDICVYLYIFCNYMKGIVNYPTPTTSPVYHPRMDPYGASQWNSVLREHTPSWAPAYVTLASIFRLKMLPTGAMAVPRIDPFHPRWEPTSLATMETGSHTFVFVSLNSITFYMHIFLEFLENQFYLNK